MARINEKRLNEEITKVEGGGVGNEVNVAQVGDVRDKEWRIIAKKHTVHDVVQLYWKHVKRIESEEKKAAKIKLAQERAAMKNAKTKPIEPLQSGDAEIFQLAG